jgi:hypothetical protein
MNCGEDRAGRAWAVERGGRMTSAASRRATGEPALFHREECPAAGVLAARDRAHRAQDRAILLPAAPDPGHERGLGNLLALHLLNRLYEKGHGQRRLS